MFEKWRLRRKHQRKIRACEAIVRKAEKDEKSPDEIESLVHDIIYEEMIADEEMSRLVTKRLVAIANRLLLSTDAETETGHMTSRQYYTPDGIMTMRNRIREETAARRKAFLEWASPLVGIIGAVTGLLAVILAMA